VWEPQALTLIVFVGAERAAEPTLEQKFLGGAQFACVVYAEIRQLALHGLEIQTPLV
jgi:hypothetical protein